LDPGTTGYSNYTVSPTASILLSANTKYWVVVSVDQATDLPFPVLWRTTSSQTADTGSTSTTVSSTQIRYSADGGSTWSNAGAGNTMYSLSGTAVPEPSSACLLVGGLAGMIPLLRRFRQRKH